MSALECVSLRLLNTIKAVELGVSENLRGKECAGVLFFSRAPLAVLVVESGPIVVNGLVQLDVTDGHTWETDGDALLEKFAKEEDDR